MATGIPTWATLCMILITVGTSVRAESKRCQTWPKKRIYLNTMAKFNCSGAITHYKLCHNTPRPQNGSVTLILHMWDLLMPDLVHTRGSGVVKGITVLNATTHDSMSQLETQGNYSKGDYLGYELVYHTHLNISNGRCSIGFQVTNESTHVCDTQTSPYVVVRATSDCYKSTAENPKGNVTKVGTGKMTEIETGNMTEIGTRNMTEFEDWNTTEFEDWNTTYYSIENVTTSTTESTCVDTPTENTRFQLILVITIAVAVQILEIAIFVVTIIMCYIRVKRGGRKTVSTVQTLGWSVENPHALNTNHTPNGDMSEHIYETSEQHSTREKSAEADCKQHYSFEQSYSPVARMEGDCNSSTLTEGKIPERLYHVLEENYAQSPHDTRTPNLAQLEEEQYSAVREEWRSEGAHAVSKIQPFPNAPIYEMEEMYQSPADTIEGVYQQIVAMKTHHVKTSKEGAVLKEQLGEGEFGAVFRGEWMPVERHKDVAFKTLHKQTKENKMKLLQEAAIMGQFNHSNVVRLYGVIMSEEKTMMAMEYLSEGDLHNYLANIREDPASCEAQQLPEMLLRFCQEIASGMAYLSSKGFIHRDLAARNVLLDSKPTCKIADFGMSRDLEEDYYYKPKGGRIPVKWTAPEAILYRKYSTKSDVWSYGMVMYEIWSLGHKPFEEFTIEEVLKQLDTGYCLPPPPGCPKPTYGVMVECWHPNSHERPSFSSILTNMECTNEGLLKVTEEEKTSEKCHVLGAELSEGRDLYKSLQLKYKSNNRN